MAGLPIPPEFLAQPLPPDAALVPPELAYQPQPYEIDGALPAPVPIAQPEPTFPAATVSQGLPVPPEFTFQPEPPQPAPPEAIAAPAPVAPPPPPEPVDPRSPEQVAQDRAQGSDPLIAATYAAGAARADKAEKVGEAKKRYADEDAQRIALDEAWDNQKRAELDKSYQDHALEVERLANAKVDPKRMAKEASLFESLATAIGFMAGGALSVRNGSGVNEFQKYYQGLVDRDMAAQEAELSNRRAAVGMKGNLLGDLRAQFGDDRAAKSMFRAVHNDKAAKQLEAYALTLDSPIFRRDAAREAAGLRAARDKEIAAAAQQTWENNFKNRQLAEQRRSNQAQEGIARSRIHAEKDATQVKSEGIPILGPSGKVIGYSTSPDRADREKLAHEARLIVDNQKRLRVLYDEGKRLFKDGWSMNPWSAERKAQEQWSHDWVNARKTANGDFSVPNESDKKAFGINDEWGPDNPMAQIDQGYRNGRLQGAGALEARGVNNDALVGEGLADPPDFEEKAVRPGELPGKSVTEIASDAQKITQGVPITDTATGEVTYRSPEAVQFLSRYGERYRPATPEELKTARGAAEAEAKQKQLDDAKREAFSKGQLR